MSLFQNLNKIRSYLSFVLVAILGLVIFVTVESGDKNNFKVEKILLSYDENKVFSIEPYIDCLYEVNKDKTNKCLEVEIKSFIDKGDPSDALHLIRVIDENDEYIIGNCQYLSERIGKVFTDLVSIDNLLSIDFNYCNYGFQKGVFGKFEKDFLKDKSFLTLVEKTCNKYNADGSLSAESEACFISIANLLGDGELSPSDSKDFCVAIGDLKGICSKNLLINYAKGLSANKLSKEVFSNKDLVVDTHLNFCKSQKADNTANCIVYAIANIFSHNEKLIYLIADYCAKVGRDNSERCYREIARGFNISLESDYSNDNKENLNKNIEPGKIFKIFTDNQPEYCNFLSDFAGVNKDLVGQCYIGYTLTLLDYYKVDEAKVCKYFNKKEYGLCKTGIKIYNGNDFADKYKLDLI